MKFDFDQRIDRTQSISIKWSPELRQQMYGERDIIPMGIADMDFKTAPAVAEAIQRRAAHETYRAGIFTGVRGLAEAPQPLGCEAGVDRLYARRQYGAGVRDRNVYAAGRQCDHPVAGLLPLL